MKLAFWKKSKEPVVEAKPAAPAVAVAVAPPKPTVEDNVKVVVDLLTGLTQEKDANSQDTKFLRAAFSKASSFLREDPTVVTEATVKALVELATTVKDKELRQDAITALGAIAVKYPAHAEVAMPVLTAALSDTGLDVRSVGIYTLTDIGKTNKDKAAAVVEIFAGAATSGQIDVREGAIVGLTTLALKNEEFAGKAVQVLSTALAADPATDSAAQSYTGRNRAAFGLGQIALAYPAQLDEALKGLSVGLNDKDIFVQYRTIESLEEVGRKYEAKKDEIVASLEKAKPNAIYIVGQKLGGAVNTLRPPVKPQKSPEEAAAEKTREEANQKALADTATKREAEARLKALADVQKKQRLEGIKNLANRLPGKAL